MEREVKVFDGTFLDYSLKVAGDARLYVEAKSVGGNLDDKKFGEFVSANTAPARPSSSDSAATPTVESGPSVPIPPWGVGEDCLGLPVRDLHAHERHAGGSYGSRWIGVSTPQLDEANL